VTSLPGRNSDDAEHAIVLHELDEAEEVLRTTERRRDRHTLWAALGISPALIVPFVLGWSMDGIGAAGVIAAAVAMTAFETVRAWRAHRELPELRRIASERRAEVETP
jgi:hypothetical protein